MIGFGTAEPVRIAGWQISNDHVGTARLAPGSASRRQRWHGHRSCSPLTIVWTSIGCIVAPIEILPTFAPASDGRPSAPANSSDIKSRPPCDGEQLRIGIVIVLMSFDVEKRETGFGVAHSEVEACAG